jgi:hypothetical protein
MTLIKVPKPPKSAYDPGRPMNTLLEWQVEHLHEAEKRLPVNYQTRIYTNAIKTEGEAAEYIRAVTEAIRDAHKEAAARRVPPAVKRKRVIEIAAAAEHRAMRARTTKRRTSGAKKKKKK